jgi:intracellular septation protein A
MSESGVLSLVAGEGELASAPGERRALSLGPVLMGLGRRSLPHLLEATLIPTVLFYVLLVTIGAAAAMLGVLCWTFVAVARRLVRGRAIPSILLLATVGLTVRTLIGLVSGSTFAYFIQPIATTVVLAAVFAGSVVIGRPVVARFASDFCDLEPEITDRPRVIRLFRGLTLLWAGVHIVTSAATFGMLITLPTATYVALKTVACLSITVAAIVLTVSCAVRTARMENLVFAKVVV